MGRVKKRIKKIKRKTTMPRKKIKKLIRSKIKSSKKFLGDIKNYPITALIRNKKIIINNYKELQLIMED